MIDHTITEEGEVNFYTIKWADGSIDKNIPKEMVVEEESHYH